MNVILLVSCGQRLSSLNGNWMTQRKWSCLTCAEWLLCVKMCVPMLNVIFLADADFSLFAKYSWFHPLNHVLSLIKISPQLIISVTFNRMNCIFMPTINLQKVSHLSKAAFLILWAVENHVAVHSHFNNTTSQSDRGGSGRCHSKIMQSAAWMVSKSLF